MSNATRFMFGATIPSTIARMMRIATALLALFGALACARAAEYPVAPDSDLVGQVQVIEARYEDTFVKLAREYDVGYEALRRANPDVDPWLPGEGTPIRIPSQYVLPRAERTGIVINLPELRLYYFPDADHVITHPISIGRVDWSTPLGNTSVSAKTPNPAWYPPESIRAEHAAMNDPLPRVVPPGPDNPLGRFALRLAIPGYLIHGTNKPAGVGMRVSHGCIRMFPEDIESLFGMVRVGTPVHIVSQPFKLGWGADGLYLEAHLPLDKSSEDDDTQDGINATELTRLFVAATAERYSEVDWDSAEQVMQAARGIPKFVSVTGVLSRNQ
jgi:L,D-transpeptidase ErfK/SrfK